MCDRLLVALVELALQLDGEGIVGAGADAGQGVPEAVGDAPGVAALADDDALDAQFQRRLADAQGDLAQLVVVADEHAEVAGLRGLRGQRPGNAGGVEDLGVADQAVDVRLGEEVGRGGDQQDFGALHVQRELDVDAGVFLDVLFQAFQGVGQRRAGQAEVVADLVHLADDLVRVLLAVADRIEDLAAGHGDLGGVDAVGAEHRAAAALGALVVVLVPVVEHLAREVLAPTSFGNSLPARVKWRR
jgi:hypothetical protein